eukprot:6146674-Amphidinium_carterae.1
MATHVNLYFCQGNTIMSMKLITRADERVIFLRTLAKSIFMPPQSIYSSHRSKSSSLTSKMNRKGQPKQTMNCFGSEKERNSN